MVGALQLQGSGHCRQASGKKGDSQTAGEEGLQP